MRVIATPNHYWITAVVLTLPLGSFAAALALEYHPLAAAAALAVAVSLSLAVAWPVETAWVLGFLTAAFPKAGVKLGGFPFPVFLFGLLLALAILIVKDRPPLARSAAGASFLFFTLWCFGRVGIMVSTGMTTASYATFAAWAIVPALILFAASATKSTRLSRGFGSSIDRGFMLAAVYGLIQYAFGLEATRIPGLTIALNDSYEDKHLAIFGGDYGYTKIPSTYQGGNLYGIVAAFFLITAAQRVLQKTARRQDVALLILAGLAVALSGSRTGILVAGVGLTAVFLSRSATPTRKVLVLGAGIVGYGIALMLQPALASRYSVSDITDTGGAGRFDAWSYALRTMNWQEWLFGVDSNPRWTATEGGPGLIQQLGLIGLALLVWLGAVVLRRGGEWRVALAAVAASALVDSAFMYFPAFFLPAARALSPLDTRPPRTDRAGVPVIEDSFADSSSTSRAVRVRGRA